MCSITPLFPAKFGLSSFENPSLSHADSFFPHLPSTDHRSLQWDDKMDIRQSLAESTNGNNSISISNSSDDLRGKHENATAIKKLSHNASERDRRKKLNALYASLRSLLPAADHTKKLSIPVTLSKVLKYIPEQQQEVERLCQRKEEILKRILRQSRDSNRQEKQKERLITSGLSPGITINQLSETEIAVQISTIERTAISDVLLSLEENGLRVMSASSLVPSGTRFFHSLHLEMDKDCEVKFEELSDMILATYKNKDQRHATKQNFRS